MFQLWQQERLCAGFHLGEGGVCSGVAVPTPMCLPEWTQGELVRRGREQGIKGGRSEMNRYHIYYYYDTVLILLLLVLLPTPLYYILTTTSTATTITILHSYYYY